VKESKRIESIFVDSINPLAHLLRRKVDDDYIRELALSIKEKGLLNPVSVVVTDGVYNMFAGYCRWLATKWLGREKILARIFDASPDEMQTLALIENLQRRDLDPLEEASGLRHMIDHEGSTPAQLSKSLGKSEGWIRNRLAILDWPDHFIQALVDKFLAYGALEEFLKIDDVSYRDYLFKIACENGVTVAVARSWASTWQATHVPTPADNLPSTSPSVDHAPLIQRLVCWGCGEAQAPVDITYEPLCTKCISTVGGK
jgi:ParB family chromosome partitioning protein